MAIKARKTGVGDEVMAIVRKRSEAEVDKIIPKLKARLRGILWAWSITIRRKLSNPAPQPWGPNMPRNKTAWPKMRTGKLRDTVLLPQAKWTPRTESWKKNHYKTTVKFTVANFFGIRKNARGADVGKYLNSMPDYDKDGNHIGVKPFAGWRTRAIHHFYDKIEERSFHAKL
jgi:hypothetical protein